MVSVRPWGVPMPSHGAGPAECCEPQEQALGEGQEQEAPSSCLPNMALPPAGPRVLNPSLFSFLSQQDKKLRIFDPRASPAASQVLSLLAALCSTVQAALSTWGVQ